jgi:hypothetical protein
MMAAIKQITGSIPALRKGQMGTTLQGPDALPPPMHTPFPPPISSSSSTEWNRTVGQGKPSLDGTPPPHQAPPAQASSLHIMTVPQQSVPVRPHVIPPQQATGTSSPRQLIVYQSFKPALRPQRLVPSSISQEELEEQITQARIAAARRAVRTPAETVEEPLQPLLPGMMLRRNRYALHSMLGSQGWLGGVYETMWLALDAQRHGELVMVCEVGAVSGNLAVGSAATTVESSAIALQTMLRNAIVTLTSIGRHAHIPALWDAFSEQGRHFFVFEAAGGESLLTCMQRSGLTLPESDVVMCCLQMLEVLEFLSQQASPLVHSLIRPEYIMIGRGGGHYILAGCSVVMAGGARQFATGIGRDLLSPYSAPEFSEGMIDGRCDLYSVLATAYFALTGSLPVSRDSSGYIPPPQHFNPRISSECSAILERGLLPALDKRSIRLRGVRQAFQALYARNGTDQYTSIKMSEKLLEPPGYGQMLPALPEQLTSSEGYRRKEEWEQNQSNNSQDHGLPLLQPEDLLPEEPGQQKRNIYWVAGCVLFVLIVVLVIRWLI